MEFKLLKTNLILRHGREEIFFQMMRQTRQKNSLVMQQQLFFHGQNKNLKRNIYIMMI